MPTLRDYAMRCRRLALTVRSDTVREHLLVMATQMEADAARHERAEAAKIDREAG